MKGNKIGRWISNKIFLVQLRWRSLEIKTRINLIRTMMIICVIFTIIIMFFILPVGIITVFPIPDDIPNQGKPIASLRSVIILSIIAFFLITILFYCIYVHNKLENKKIEKEV